MRYLKGGGAQAFKNANFQALTQDLLKAELFFLGGGEPWRFGSEDGGKSKQRRRELRAACKPRTFAGPGECAVSLVRVRRLYWTPKCPRKCDMTRHDPIETGTCTYFLRCFETVGLLVPGDMGGLRERRTCPVVVAFVPLETCLYRL